ncbi:hypothetical protein DLAC_03647 [Tieghemostelium lacteum]|uniref:D-serine dehydratase n=1 Tax=Tieghemostelium lacteum TaxID=361077 RepID=A0A152A0D8_TIELA|nr:hypothetical protein DLAC_03647 [Tieghemostelium lacteum]|eukprot:KYQ99707.1 hypothetical protein DLAC_03647 [Tieghemostelium lacteum]
MQKNRVNLKHLSTPCVLVDKDVVKNNCKRMIDRAIELGVNIRPHMKTHKTLEIGQFQVSGLDYSRVIVSTLSEAEFFSSQFKDILYAIPISPNKLTHALFIHSKIDDLHLMIDHRDHIDHLVEHLKNSGDNSNLKKYWSVFLKIDCGYHRAGCQPDSPDTIELVDYITKGRYSHYFKFQGIYTHSGHSYKCQTPKEIEQIAISEATVAGNFGKILKQLGYPCPTVSIGSTPVCSHLPQNLKELGVTEIHPGNYVFYDLMGMELGNCKLSDVGVSVLATVISVYPDRNELLLDSGSLALSSDPGCTHLINRTTPNFGIFADDPNLRLVAVTQEIGKVQSTNQSPIPFEKYPIGSRVKIIPNHSCLTAAMFSNYHVISSKDNYEITTETFVPNKHW